MTYDELRRDASILKLRALKLRALGGDEDTWRAVVAFRQAAKIELDALDLLRDPSFGVEIAARVEACGLFLEARDLVRATVQWRLLSELIHVSRAGNEDLAELEPVFKREHARFARAWQEFKKTLPKSGSLEQAKAAPIRKLCAEYPGVPEFWWSAYRYADAHGKWAEAKKALQRARELDPANVRYVAMDVFLNPLVLGSADALEACRADWLRFRDISAEVNQMFGLALLRLSRGSELRAQLLDEILDAAQRAEKLAAATSLGRQAFMLRRYVEVLRQGRPPTISDFARIGIVSLPPTLEFDKLEDELIERCKPSNDNARMPMAVGM